MNQSVAETRERLRKFSNSYTFAKVMGDNPDLCKRVIERILGIEIKDLVMVSSEETFTFIEEKGIRCDILASDSNTYYEVEMQSYSDPDLDRRMQYYESAMTVRSAKKGMPYAKIPPRVLIMICTYDHYEGGRSFYSFSTRCNEDYEIVQNRGTTDIVINASTIDSNLPEDLANLLRYVQNGAVNQNDSLVCDLDIAIDEALRDESWVSFVNTFEIEAINREYRIAQKSREEGREEGLSIGIRSINELVAEGILTPEQGAERIEQMRVEAAQAAEFCDHL